MQRNGAGLPRNLNTTMMKKKVMITGSSGFLGSRLALFLKDACDLQPPALSKGENQKAAPIQMSILTPCVSSVMMQPAMTTPRKMTGTARFRRMLSTAAISAPVHAPVPGSGMATKIKSPHV